MSDKSQDFGSIPKDPSSSDSNYNREEEKPTPSTFINPKSPSTSQHQEGSQDSDILVNIDGSMQDRLMNNEWDREEDAGRVSMDMIEIEESSEDETTPKCRRYKEEWVVLRSKIAELRHQLHDVIDRQSLFTKNNDGLEKEQDKDDALGSPITLHSMLGDCSKSLYHLKSILDKRSQSVGSLAELRSVLNAKDQEIENLNAEVSLHSVPSKDSTNVVIKRVLASLASVFGSSEDPIADGISLVERRTLLLIEKHAMFLSEMRKLEHCLAQVRPYTVISDENESGCIFSVARKELIESNRKKSFLLEKVMQLEEEKKKMSEEIDRIKESSETTSLSNELRRVSEEVITLRNKKDFRQEDLEQAEERSSILRKGLSIAVKGKSMVQRCKFCELSPDGGDSEIEKLKQELQLQQAAAAESKKKLKSLSDSIVILKGQSAQIKRLYLANKDTADEVFDTVKQIILTEKIFRGPVEKVKWIAEHIHELEVSHAHVEEELQKVKEEATLLSDELSQAQQRISVIAEEKEQQQLGRTSIEQELKKVKEEADVRAIELTNAYETIRSLEDALSQAEKKLSS